jgi:hypothetical protein
MGPRGCRGVRARGAADAHAQGKREGYVGREKGRERGREREEEELTLGSKSGDHRLQNLGHNGGREREVEERKLLRGKIE